MIVEPVAGNMGLVTPDPGFLEALRALCTKHGAVLIFDEVMTGFRLAAGGVQELFGVMPDMTTLGKIIGGGLPVGAYGGRKDIMDFIAPVGKVYQAGTLSGNPIATAAGLAMLRYLHDHPAVYVELSRLTDRLTGGMKQNLADLGLPAYTINQVGSMFSIFFTTERVFDFPSAQKSDLALFARYFQAMLRRGVYLAPSQYESLFVSVALTDELVEQYLKANRDALVEAHG